jgi:hypothetical protein
MPAKKPKEDAPPNGEEVQAAKDVPKTCFVMMPFTTPPAYDLGHFDRVYEHVIKPACKQAGFEPDRSDDSLHTHVILLKMLQRILDADMVLCDLSAKNPNVMYELGIRQAFDKPVTLIKDDRTERVFDTGVLSDVVYAADLRYDNVVAAVGAISARLKATYEHREEEDNSLIRLLKRRPAAVPQGQPVSADTGVILDALSELSRRISAVDQRNRLTTGQPNQLQPGQFALFSRAGDGTMLAKFTTPSESVAREFLSAFRETDSHQCLLQKGPGKSNYRFLVKDVSPEDAVSVAAWIQVAARAAGFEEIRKYPHPSRVNIAWSGDN